MKIRNNNGPKTVPWVSPLRTSALSEVAPTVTRCDLCMRKAFIQFKVLPLTP